MEFFLLYPALFCSPVKFFVMEILQGQLMVGSKLLYNQKISQVGWLGSWAYGLLPFGWM